MRVYESIFIASPTLSEEEVNQTTELIQNVITSNGGEVVKVDKWGKRPLAYEIKKQREGYYVLLLFNADPKVLSELDRRYKLTDHILRYNIIKLGDKPGELPPGYGQYTLDTQFVGTEFAMHAYDEYEEGKEEYEEEEEVDESFDEEIE
jgi:small subunit ribosomal protein S6